MRLLLNYSDTNPTSLRHPPMVDCSRLHKTGGAEWTTNAPKKSSLSTASWGWWWALLSITVRTATNSKDVNGSCDKGTHHATRPQEFTRRRQITTGCENNPCGFKHERHKGPCKPSEHDEETVKTNTSARMDTGQDARSWSKDRALNTDEPQARICAATDIASTDISLKNLYVDRYTVPSRKTPFKTHVKRDPNCPTAMKTFQTQSKNTCHKIFSRETKVDKMHIHCPKKEQPT